MFDLTKSIDLWKMDFYKNEAFTKDDIDELESHLLDKIEELLEQGLSEEEAFTKAKDTLGSAEVLHQDFHIVNNMKVLGKKIILGLCGYIFIFSIINLITSFTTLIMLPFVDNLADLPTIKTPSFLTMILGNYFSSLILLKLFTNMLLGITVVYFLVSNKVNVVNWLINKFNSSIKNKIYSIINIALIPILSLVIRVLVNPRGFNSIIVELYNCDFLFIFIFKFIIIMAFSYLIYKKPKETKNSLWTLAGYIIGLTFVEVMPNIISYSIVLFNISGIAAKIVFFTSYILIMATTLYLIVFSKVKLLIDTKNKYKLSVEYNKKIRLLVSSITFIVLSSTIFISTLMLPLIYRVTRSMTILDEISMIGEWMQLIIIILAQVIAMVMLIKRTKIKLA